MLQFQYLLPEIFLLICACINLFIKKKEIFAFLSILFTLSVVIYFFKDIVSEIYILNNLVFISRYTQFIKILILSFTIIFLLQFFAVKNDYNKKFVMLILFSTIGMMLTISSATLLSLYLAIELQILPLYALTAIEKKSIKSSEAGVKFFTLGSLASAIIVYGISLVFASTGSIQFVSILTNVTQVSFIGLMLVTSGILFKLAVFPFHAWLPDVYEGAPNITTAYLATISNISIIAFLALVFSGHFNIIEHYSIFGTAFDQISQKSITFIALLSLFFGSFCAIKQINLKRFIAYASIVHMGYILLGILNSTNDSIIINPAVFYIIIYSIINFGIFSFLFMISSQKISNLAGFAKREPIIAFSFAVLLFSSAGIPPFAGFFSKLYIIKSLIDANHIIIAVIALIAGILSAFYYLKIIKIMYFDKLSDDTVKIVNSYYLLKFILFLSVTLNAVMPFILL